jgi:hypothetical protein
VQNVVFLGDFNIDFKQNTNTGTTNKQQTDHITWQTLTPTLGQGGSAAPPAGAGTVPTTVPAVPFALPDLMPDIDLIANQSLRASCTTEGTILKKLDATFHPTNASDLRGAAFDQFFYGGAVMNSAVLGQGTGGVDSGEIIDIPSNIRQPGGVIPVGQISVAALQQHYAGLAKPTKSAQLAPNLAAQNGVPPPPALTWDDRWIGARLVSDHLPVILQVACP